jgi:hypothetical protein
MVLNNYYMGRAGLRAKEKGSQAGLIPREPAHAHSVYGIGFVAFLWQIPPIRPVLPVLPVYNCFAVSNLC